MQELLVITKPANVIALLGPMPMWIGLCYRLSGVARNFDFGGACTGGSGSWVAQRFRRFASGASEKIFDPPHLLLTWGDIKQDDTVFITEIMTCKRLCSHAPNDYNSGLCDYYGYGEIETMKECHF